MDTMTTMLADHRWTREERDALPADGQRHELLDGVLLVNAAPTPRHQMVLAGLYDAMRAACPADLITLFAPLDVTLSADTVLEPDLLVARRDAFGPRDLPGPPLLAVEVLSPSTRGIDRLLKFERYQRAGVPSYWIVDPDAPTLTAFELVDGTYTQVADVAPGRTWTARAPFEATLDPAAWCP